MFSVKNILPPKVDSSYTPMFTTELFGRLWRKRIWLLTWPRVSTITLRPVFLLFRSLMPKVFLLSPVFVRCVFVFLMHFEYRGSWEQHIFISHASVFFFSSSFCEVQLSALTTVQNIWPALRSNSIRHLWLHCVVCTANTFIHKSLGTSNT